MIKEADTQEYYEDFGLNTKDIRALNQACMKNNIQQWAEDHNEVC